MHTDPQMRCICNILRIPEIKDFISSTALLSGCDVVYHDDAAVLDDLDYVDRVTAHAEGYDAESYRYHCGSLWARREQTLQSFWDHLVQSVDDIGILVPVLFTGDTMGNDLYD